MKTSSVQTSKGQVFSDGSSHLGSPFLMTEPHFDRVLQLLSDGSSHLGAPFSRSCFRHMENKSHASPYGGDSVRGMHIYRCDAVSDAEIDRHSVAGKRHAAAFVRLSSGLL